MNDNVRKKLYSKFSMLGLKITFEDTAHLRKKPYKIYEKLMREFPEVRDFHELRNVWKGNIVLSRFIFKYALFIESFLDATIENALLHDLEKVIHYIKLDMDGLSGETGKKAKEKNDTLFSAYEELCKMRGKSFILKEYSFSEKINIYKTFASRPEFTDFQINANLNKIRTLRNDAVHSNIVIKKMLDSTKYYDMLLDMIDEPYKGQFREEFKNIVSKYSLKKYF